ncbi:MAG TPA: saccharopine dehydrogenase NADP-binding domain-containing protein, partial [Noviherbaspirillum sp.]|nr:saccharopine dehydrogenase NADP-binding domain-containing protein [Noviherbaspirillum sp.]
MESDVPTTPCQLFSDNTWAHTFLIRSSTKTKGSAMKSRLILLGAGKIGDAILNLLSHSGDYRITVADRDPARLAHIDALRFPDVQTVRADVSEAGALVDLIDGHEVTVSASPYFLTPAIAAAAKKAGSHYFDLTEDVESTRAVKQLAEDTDTAFVPQCGLA